MRKTREQLEGELCKKDNELNLRDCLKEERQESDKLYAKIIVQTIVYTFIAAIAFAFLATLFMKMGWKQ